MTGRWMGLVLLVLTASAQAQTQYVTDRTIVELRRGPSLEYLILRNLEAGEAVEVLEQDDSNGYSRVRVLDQGTEGWILTRFLTSEPIARERLATAERNLAAARQKITELEQQLEAATSELSSTQSALEKTRSNESQASQELADIKRAAADVIGIRDQNNSLRQRLVQRDRQVEELSATNTQLAARDNQNWFIVGAGVLFGGIVIGLIAPSLRRKRRSDW